MNAVALRVAPPRSSTTRPKGEAKAGGTGSAKPAKEEPAADTRSAMERLLDKFK